MDPLFLTDEQKQTLVKYIKERRYVLISALATGMLLLIVNIPLLIWDISDVQDDGFLHYERTARGGHFTGTFAIVWCIIALIWLFVFLRNYGVKYGIGCDLQCVRHDEYTLSVAPAFRKSENELKPPFYFYDDERRYATPNFIAWKKADLHSRILYITLKNNRGYALVLPEETKEGDDSWQI